MTWFPDLSRYSYMEAEPLILNIGWLDAGSPFGTGEVDPEFVARLTELCKMGVKRTRGLHRCNLCPESVFDGAWPPAPNRTESPTGDYIVGGAEIRVSGPDGTVYAAPDLIIHYVTEHRYKPPDPFIAAVIRQYQA